MMLFLILLNCQYLNDLCYIANGVAGICNLVYENLPSHSEVSTIAYVIDSNALELVGNGMLEYNV